MFNTAAAQMYSEIGIITTAGLLRVYHCYSRRTPLQSLRSENCHEPLGEGVSLGLPQKVELARNAYATCRRGGFFWGRHSCVLNP